MLQLKLCFSIFLILVLIQTILSVPVGLNKDSEDCEKSHKCSVNVKPSSYVESNKKLTQSSSISSQHKETKVVSEGDNNLTKEVLATLSKQESIHVSPKSGDILSNSNHVQLSSQSSQQSLAQSSKHEITAVKSEHGHVQPHQYSGDANNQLKKLLGDLSKYQSTKSEHKSHESNEQLTQSLLQLLAQSSKHEITAVKSEREHVHPYENSGDANYQLRKLLEDLSKHQSTKNEHKSHESNEQLTQLLLQLLAKSSKHELTVVESEHGHVQPHQYSGDANYQLKKLLDDLSKHQSTKNEHKSQESNEQLTHLLLQLLAKSSKHELTVVKSEREHVHPDKNSGDANYQLRKLLEDLSKHQSTKNEHKSHESNEQLTQLLLQILAKSSKHELTVVESEHGHVQPHQYSGDANYQLRKLLENLSKHQSTKNEHKSHESNEQLTQLLLQQLAKSSKHELTVVESEHGHVQPHQYSGDANYQLKKLLEDLSKHQSTKNEHKSHESNEQLTQLLLQLLAKSSKHELTVVESEREHVHPHENSCDANCESTKVEHKSHNANEQIIQVLLEVLSHKSKHERDHVVPHDVNTELLKLLVKLIQKKSINDEHKSHDTNDQLTQLLLQLLVNSMKHEPDHVPTHKNSVDRSVLIKLLLELCKYELSEVKETSHDFNSQLTQFVRQLLEESRKHEQTSVESKRDFVLPSVSYQNPVELPIQEFPNIQPESNNAEASPKLIPTVTGLVGHSLDDVQGTLGKVTSILA